MAHLITFTSSQFDVSVETPNPINPIAGEGVLKWLREKLVGPLLRRDRAKARGLGLLI
jgi:hypothetical protein